MLCRENESIELHQLEPVMYCVDCECGHRTEMSETVYGLLQNGNIEILCRGCEKPILHWKSKDIN